MKTFKEHITEAYRETLTEAIDFKWNADVNHQILGKVILGSFAPKTGFDASAYPATKIKVEEADIVKFGSRIYIRVIGKQIPAGNQITGYFEKDDNVKIVG